MSLQGTIESFGISEIFQLIAHQGKTGSLEIQTPEGLAKLRFLEGQLVEAWPDHRSPAERIGSLLVRSGLITQIQLQHALDAQRQSLRRLGDILIRMGSLRISEFREILALQHRETVYNLLRLNRGHFRFIIEPVDVEEGVSILLDVGSVLMEGFRQIDEWPNLLAKIPSDKKVYALAPDLEISGDLTPEESHVLNLVDGNHTVREILDRSRLGEFNAWEALAGLHDRGYLKPVGTSRKPRNEFRPVRSRRVLDMLVAVALCAATIGLIGFFRAVAEPPVTRLEAAWHEARSHSQLAAKRALAWRTRTPDDGPRLGAR